MSVSIDPTVHLAPCPALVEQIRSSLSCSSLPPAGVGRVLKEGGHKEYLLTVSDLQWLSTHMRQPMGDLLLSSRLVLPSPVTAERSKELEERCVKLRAEQREKEYREMTENVRRHREKGETGMKEHMREVNGFLLLILQFVVSVVCSFLFGYLSPYYILGRQELGTRLLCGIVCGFVVGCADMYFVIRQMLEEDGIKLAKKID